MQPSGTHQRPRVASEGNACERFELESGSMTLGWSSAGDVLCILAGDVGAAFAQPLEARLTDVLGRAGRLRLWLDLFDLRSADEGFAAGLAPFLHTYGPRVTEARAVVAHEPAARAVALLDAHLGGRIEVLGDPESQAELYARFARGA
jgi:hypothetical protein